MKTILKVVITISFLVFAESCEQKKQIAQVAHSNQDEVYEMPVDEDPYSYIDEEEPNGENEEDTRLPYKNFTLLFRKYKLASADYNFELDTVTVIRKDSLFLGEEVFNDLDNKLLQIIPENQADKFKVYFTVEEQILEIFDEKFNKSTNEQQNYILWSGRQGYRQLKDSADYFFRMPAINQEAIIKARKAKFALKDTTIQVLYTGEYSSGEVEILNALKYKGKACHIYIPEGLILIERYNGSKLAEKRFILILFSEGC